MQVLLITRNSPLGKTAEVVAVIGEHRPSCYYRAREYTMLLPGCRRFSVGSVVRVIGSVDPHSAKQFFVAKRLDVQAVEPLQPRWSEALFWRTLLTRQASRGRAFLAWASSSVLEAPFAGLLTAFLLGGSWRLSVLTQSFLKVTGIQHMAAASGFHLSLVASGARGGVRRFSRRTRGSVLLVVGAAYLLLAGGPPSLLRASLVFSLAVIGRYWCFSQVQPVRLLIIAVTLIVLMQPYFMSQIGFQLSVAATLGILLLARPVLTKQGLVERFVLGDVTSRKTDWWHSLQRYLGEAVVISLAAQLAVAPLLIVHFGEISLGGVVATALLSWMIPTIFISGIIVFVGGITGVFEPLVAMIGWVPLALFWFGLAVLAKVLPPPLELAHWSAWGVLGWYSLLGLVALLLARQQRRQITRGWRRLDTRYLSAAPS